EQESLGERLVNRAADETLPGTARYWIHRYGRWGLAAAVLLALGAGVFGWRALRGRAAAVVPAPVQAAAPAVDAEAQRLRARLAEAPETELTAFTQLLARWQVDADAVSVREASRCPPLVAAGIACLRGQATLEQLARFDRPLILL